MRIFFYFILVFVLGYCLSRLIGGQKTKLAHIILFGFGMMGFIYFWVLYLWNLFQWFGFLGLIALVLLLAGLVIKRSDIKFFVPIEVDRVDLFVLLFLLLMALQHYYGLQDFGAAWNIKAKFLVSDQWKQLFLLKGNFGHPEFPLLVPSIIASGWMIGGTMNTFVPFLIFLLLSWSLYLLLKSGLSLLMNQTYAILGALFLVSMPAFIRWSVSQYADIPLSVFLLCGILLIYHAKNQRIMILSGLAFGLAAFTKIEGLFYDLLLLTSFIFTLIRVKRTIPWRSIVLVMIGSIPGIIAALFIANSALQLGVITQYFTLFDVPSFAHISQILIGFIYEWISWREWMFFWILMIPLFILLRRSKTEVFWNLFFSAFFILCAIAFFVIYLFLSPNLALPYSTSFNRLLLQIAPIMIFAVFVRLKDFQKNNNSESAKKINDKNSFHFGSDLSLF